MFFNVDLLLYNYVLYEGRGANFLLNIEKYILFF